MIRYVTYFRVSTERQGRNGLGMAAQERDVFLFLNGFSEVPWEVVATFTDVQSGKDDDRPELAKALVLVRKTGATLLVAKLDRLGRRLASLAAIMDDPRINLRVAESPNASKLELGIKAVIAETERDFISARTKAALREAKARGTKLGGIRPKTEARNAAVQTIAKADADRVAAIVLPLRNQAKPATLQTIADALNAANVRTARGGSWYPMQVQRTLKRLAAPVPPS